MLGPCLRRAKCCCVPPGSNDIRQTIRAHRVARPARAPAARCARERKLASRITLRPLASTWSARASNSGKRAPWSPRVSALKGLCDATGWWVAHRAALCARGRPPKRARRTRPMSLGERTLSGGDAPGHDDHRGRLEGRVACGQREQEERSDVPRRRPARACTRSLGSSARIDVTLADHGAVADVEVEQAIEPVIAALERVRMTSRSPSSRRW